MILVGEYIGKKVGKSMSLTDKIIELCSYDDEQEWFEFKENWFQPEELGEYVSALSNTAAFHYQEIRGKGVYRLGLSGFQRSAARPAEYPERFGSRNREFHGNRFRGYDYAQDQAEILFQDYGCPPFLLQGSQD